MNNRKVIDRSINIVKYALECEFRIIITSQIANNLIEVAQVRIYVIEFINNTFQIDVEYLESHSI